MTRTINDRYEALDDLTSPAPVRGSGGTMTLEQLQSFFPGATLDTWHQHPTGGGWVKNTAKVSGDAKVCGNAVVYGNAKVSGNAKVCGNAWVSGDAKVCGNAMVYGNAVVSGNAMVCLARHTISPLHILGSRHPLTLDGCEVHIGCLTHAVDYWLTHFASIGEAEGYTPAQIAEYEQYLLMAQAIKALREGDK